jgi:DHA1 family tetracycline resistance protein-like MFS transporter
MDKRLIVLCSIIALDAAGIGLIYPILPDLLRELTSTKEISVLYGAVLALYAFMQFVCSPVLGSLSDRFGRRPVMLASIGGTTVDYLAMALAPNVAVLIVGRAIAGMTSANLPVAMAYVADVTREEERASRISYLQAGFGIGFFAGPILGGLLAMWGVRLPFVAAAVLNGVTFTLAWRILPESKPPSARVPQASTATVGRWQWILASRSLLPLLTIQMLMGLIGNLSSTVWLLYGYDRYSWDNSTMAYSLALLGL